MPENSGMALTNPIITYSSGGTASVTATGGVGSAAPFLETSFQDNTLTNPPVTAIGYKADTLLAGGTVTINLFDGTLLGLDGLTAVPLTRIHYIKLVIPSTSAGGYLRIGGAASNANILWFANTSDKALVMPGGPCFAQGDPTGYVVVDTSNKNVLIENPHGSLACSYILVVGGVV